MKLSPRAAHAGVYFLVALSTFLTPPAARAGGAGDMVVAYVEGRMPSGGFRGWPWPVRKGKIVKLKGYGVASVEFRCPRRREHGVPDVLGLESLRGRRGHEARRRGAALARRAAADLVENAPAAWKSLRVNHTVDAHFRLAVVVGQPALASVPDERRIT